MNGLREKFRNKKGFTLIEMLIVVAIIAILIAISIPMVSSALERAREATDASNERSFKAALVTSYLSSQAGMAPSGADAVSSGKVYAYDAVNGVPKEATTSLEIKPYGQGTTGGGGKDSTARTNNILYGQINDKGEVSIAWGAPKQATMPAAGTLTSDFLYDSSTPASP